MDIKVSGNHKFVSLFHKAVQTIEERKQKWIKMLRQKGIKGAHPDDGWVDRKENSVYFSYPHFDDGVEIGDEIVLGWADKYRVVKVVGLKKNRLCSLVMYYRFEER